ncbi:MAG: hypothetical protein J7L34_06230, partial [Thermotogaceae bacterium]|nr:hypothetical protein [Thermotogaceae bacterium]
MVQIGTIAVDDLRKKLALEISLLDSSFSSIVNSVSFSEIKNELVLALKNGRQAMENQIRERYTLEENDGYCVVVNFDETYSKYELEHSTLLLAMENMAYAGDYATCAELLERCTKYYSIKWGDFSYDNHLYNRVTTESFSQKLVHSYVESYLISGDVSGYIAALTGHRMDLTPSMLLQSTLRLIYGFNKRPDPRIYSVIFGGSIESSPNKEKATRIGEISLDKQLRLFLSESGLGFSTGGLIKCLDSFFDYYSDKEPDWFKAAYEKAFSGRLIQSKSTDCYTAGVFNYKGWARGRESACFKWDKDVLYPDDSLANVKYC